MANINFFRFTLLALAALLLVGCHDDDNDQAAVRILHAVADAPLVNVYLNDDRVLENVDFRQGSEYLTISSGTYDVRVEAIIPGGNLDVINVTDFAFETNTWSTIAAVGSVANGITPNPIDEPTEAIGAGNIRLRVTHASPDAPAVYLAITTPDLPIDQADTLGPFSFGNTTDPLEVPAGDYQVRVTLIPNPTSDNDVVFDSGLLPLAAGADLHAFAVTSTVPSTAASGAPISLAILNGQGSFDVFDANTGANLRVVHNSPGAPGVDVFVDIIDTPAIEDVQIVTNLTYGNAAGYLSPAVAATSYNVGVRVNPNVTPDALNFNADLEAGQGYTVIANDAVDNITEWILVDDYRPVITESKVRLVHGSPSAGVVDIYVFPSADALLPADVSEPFLGGVEFGMETGFVSLAPGSYDIYITGAGSDVPAISVVGLPVVAGGVYTAIARDPDPLDMMDTELGVTLIADEP